ncbi:UDP-glucose/GDP-mannose dehydrogenase family protein [Metabacillus sp. GX 13764]|uniref:UDP-glucose dehydrogenase family protein n=1 Tax=Metabacillus kandeliae TaxID=2900151 RepID=UPI001E5DD8B3|nr:UDP-glucose/GDP-mannose dehydrogenase family protein [Metabacillus kandeliae]MCD7034495.1 UDP-glucose/GDP-mannose dehydrogenase family protein [Metabacillus kandeliae]
MNIAVVGTGYVGLVTGVCLSEIGHHITCVDIDERKVEKMRQGISPIFEPGLDDLMKENISRGRLNFTTNHKEAFADARVIYIAVGTPQRPDGQADLRFVEQVAKDIAGNIEKDVVVVTKSTVPVGTNEHVKSIVLEYLQKDVKVDVVSNPEFLREGSAVKDTFEGDRIVIGAENEEAAAVLEEVNKPFGIPIFKTDIRSAEMIKYASNAFLATKISFINEIANLCEKLEANVEDVASGMGMDDRIGNKFLKAGIGYGGSCFPKDTNALVQIASYVQHDFNLLKSVIQVNGEQQRMLILKAKERFGSLEGMKVAMLGLAFKPNTDDMREAASIVLAEELVKEGATVVAYDPIAEENARRLLPKETIYVATPEEAIQDADFAFVVTEWEQVRNLSIDTFLSKMKQPVIFDGRNCFDIEEMEKHPIEYYSVGRKPVKNI